MKLDLLSTAAGCLLAAGLCACGPRDAKPDADRQAAAAEDTAAPADTALASPADPVQQPLTVADIDRWDKGMAAELEAVHAAAEKRRTAKTADDTVAAMMALQDGATLETGAKAAGVDGERYNLIRSTFSEAASYLAPSLGGLDTTGLSAAQLATTRAGKTAQLEQMKDRVPADVLSALTARAAELRKKDLELVAARIKGAGM
jgi:hypothetical protein